MVGIGIVQIKTHDGIVRILANACHIPDLKRDLISLGTLKSNGYRYSAEGGVLKVFKRALVLMKGVSRPGKWVIRFGYGSGQVRVGSCSG